MNHTPEPWILDPDTLEIQGDAGCKVVYQPYEDDSQWWPNAREDKGRAVACVNACAGIKDPAAAIKAAREALEKAEKDLKMLQLHAQAPWYNSLNTGMSLEDTLEQNHMWPDSIYVIREALTLLGKEQP